MVVVASRVSVSLGVMVCLLALVTIITFYQLYAIDRYMVLLLLKHYPQVSESMSGTPMPWHHKIRDVTRQYLFILSRTWIDKDTFAIVTEGCLYNTLYLYDSPDTRSIAIQFRDKLHLKTLFAQLSIPMPILFAHSDDQGKWTWHHPIHASESYIVKPRFGALGYGIRREKGSDLEKQTYKDCIVEEYLQTQSTPTGCDTIES